MMIKKFHHVIITCDYAGDLLAFLKEERLRHQQVSGTILRYAVDIPSNNKDKILEKITNLIGVLRVSE